MKADLKNNRDFYAGLLFIGIGVATILLGLGYRFGSATQMGPGFFPIVLAALLIVLGLFVAIKGLRSNEKVSAPWSPRALLALTLAVLLFAVIMPRAGFVPALAVLIFGSAAASSEFKFTEVAVLTAVVTAVTATLIIGALGMPYPLFGAY